MDETALYNMSYGLYVISSTIDGKDVGCVANTLQQVTAEPVKLAVTLHKNNRTEQVIAQSGVFNGVALTKEVDMDVIKTFGFASSKDIDKYANYAYERDSLGIPYLKDHVAAYFTCKVIQQVDLDTHVMFIGEVIACEHVSKEEVMTYAYYHTIKNGGTPKNAPSYQKKTEKHGWRCSICGYIYEGDPLPVDYICPLCGAPASVFEQV